MLTACFHQPYGLHFEAFQLWDEIRNPDLKRLFVESQQALELGDPIMALVGIDIAFQAIIAIPLKSPCRPKFLEFSKLDACSQGPILHALTLPARVSQVETL